MEGATLYIILIVVLGFPITWYLEKWRTSKYYKKTIYKKNKIKCTCKIDEWCDMCLEYRYEVHN